MTPFAAIVAFSLEFPLAVEPVVVGNSRSVTTASIVCRSFSIWALGTLVTVGTTFITAALKFTKTSN